MAYLGLDVMRLVRVAFGPFRLGKLPRGGIEEVPQCVLRGSLEKFFSEKKGWESRRKVIRSEQRQDKTRPPTTALSFFNLPAPCWSANTWVVMFIPWLDRNKTFFDRLIDRVPLRS